MTLGLFDVIGPVMHGPSSNHTGGANRIGYLARQLMGGRPEKIRLGFHPAYMGSYTGQKSHTALIAGCLGFREYDDESTQSLEIAAKLGIPWEAYAIGETGRSRNTMRVTGEIRGQLWEINGDSVGGGNILIDRINGLEVSLDGNTWEVMASADTDALLRELLDFLAGLDGCKTAVSGQALEQRFLCCGTFSQEPPSAAALPPSLKQAEEEGRLVWRVVPPLYKFSDSGCPPLFTTFAQLLALCRDRDILDVILEYESRRSQVTKEEVLAEAEYLVEVIAGALAKGEKEEIRLIGMLTDPGDGKRMLAWAASGQAVVNEMFAKGLGRAMILAQLNAAAGRIVAAPTGGSAGSLPGTLFSAAERYDKDKKELAKAFLIAGAIGLIVGNQASFSGTIGGCQSEVGIGAAMGASGVIWLAGGTAEEIVQGAAIALKNVLGLTCDPPASPTEIPCIKRNAMGVAMAFFGAEMGLAGIRSAIAPDDVVAALAETQRLMPMELKFSHCGGLAATKSGRELNKQWQERLKTLK
ncbi:MAG: L-serine ammonia-lyase, iron-sulfur-dependent, subunit alpha [Peptococcaceae bacterium]|nr:L-serine ammonia-lyase, iron-sulfur-dependent, subunit alpha [Peptococcaceae bacterium]